MGDIKRKKKKINNKRIPVRLDKSTIILCPWCNQRSSLDNWNNTTYKQCDTEEMKRDFLPLYYRRTFNEEEKTFYMCPKCERWIKAIQLKLLSTNDKVSELGNKPLIKFDEY